MRKTIFAETAALLKDFYFTAEDLPCDTSAATQEEDLLTGIKPLCAEDDELNAEILKERLRMEGAECTICESDEKALTKSSRAVRSNRGGKADRKIHAL